MHQLAIRRRRDNVVIAVLAVLAVLGGGHALLDMLSSEPPAPPYEPPAKVAGRAQLTGFFAREFVTTYVSSGAAQQERLTEFVGLGQQMSLPTAGRQVADAEVAHVARAVTAGNLEVWAVTVAVRFGKAGAEQPRHYYRVGISVTDGRLRALSAPAVVAPPARGADLAQAYGTPCGTETPVAQVASGFLTAFLTGAGDVTRYTSPEAGIVALRPAPFAALQAVTVQSDDSGCGATRSEARVLVLTTPKADGGATAPLAYPLTLVRSGGQWQVRSMDPIPALADPVTVVQGHETRELAPNSSAGTSTTAASTTVRIPPATQN
ncbi:conjugal transfer protein [Nocardia sp. NPDC051832]|uniref:conjugal transfer protein n=1 Tax=Nocardia sp. NPDC051832 TaxID=3155673 RepID=UPI00343126CD